MEREQQEAERMRQQTEREKQEEERGNKDRRHRGMFGVYSLRAPSLLSVIE